MQLINMADTQFLHEALMCSSSIGKGVYKHMGISITPRERVLLALDHQDTDRVPVDFLATDETWAVLQDHLQLPDREATYKYLGIDLRHPRIHYVGPPIQRLASGGYIDPWGIMWEPKHYPGGIYFEISNHPLVSIRDMGDLDQFTWPEPDWWDIDSLEPQIRAWDSDVEYAIVLDDFGDPGGFFEISCYLRGMEMFLEDMALRPEVPNEIMRRVSHFFTILVERVLAKYGGRIDLIWTSDDVAHQQGTLISPTMWKSLILPHHNRFNQRVHDLGGRVMYHSCGAIRPFIPGLIEAGIDVLDVLQFSAKNMDPIDLKQTFGDQLCFHGGLDVQSVLPRLQAKEVGEEVKRLISILGRGGGYILSPTHNIQIDTPNENIVAAYESAGSLLRCT